MAQLLNVSFSQRLDVVFQELLDRPDRFLFVSRRALGYPDREIEELLRNIWGQYMQFLFAYSKSLLAPHFPKEE
jgi:hypothetical protein